jgi:hypothetical protein
MTLSQFRISPHQGHLDRIKRTYGYLRHYKDTAIRVCVDILEITNQQDIEYYTIGKNPFMGMYMN